jgi:hypothetical protein
VDCFCGKQPLLYEALIERKCSIVATWCLVLAEAIVQGEKQDGTLVGSDIDTDDLPQWSRSHQRYPNVGISAK